MKTIIHCEKCGIEKILEFPEGKTKEQIADMMHTLNREKLLTHPMCEGELSLYNRQSVTREDSENLL